MIVNIVCCGSSGSTLLSNRLDRHPDIISGEELNIFSKNYFFENFNLVKRNISFFLEHPMYDFPYNFWGEFLTNLECYNITDNQIKNWISESKNIKNFVYKVKKHLLKSNKSKVWVEKTPNNALALNNFLSEFNNKNTKVIHLIRNPKDVILSLNKRGYSLFNAAERWISTVGNIRELAKKNKILLIKYEDLIKNTNKTYEKICNYIDVDFKEDYFVDRKNISKNIIRKNGLNTWSNSPDNNISRSSLNKYLDSKIKFDFLDKIIISKDFANRFDINQYSYNELVDYYNYYIN